ncbi:MAG: xanthine dehydrogenase family protein subunit M [Gemmatimonadota bacterium]
MKDFAYAAPTTLREALKILAEKGAAARPLAGGTDLIVQMRARRLQPEVVVDVKAIPELNELGISPRRGLTIGAAVPCRRIYGEAEVAARYPGVVDAAAIIGGIQIQGRASFGGNLCNASPSGDSIPMLIAYGAECLIAGPGGKRTVPVVDFCTGPGANVLQPGELLVAIRVPPVRPGSGCHYLRFIPRNEMDIAVVGVGAYVELGNRGKAFKAARIGLGAVAPTPLLAREAGDLLVGRQVGEAAIAEACDAARRVARPITDMRGPAEYRSHLVGVLVRRALEGAVKRARGERVANAIEEDGQRAA